MCYCKRKVGIILYGWIEAFCLIFPYSSIFSFPKICTFFYECWLLSTLNLSDLCFSCRVIRIVKMRIMILDYICIQLVQEMHLAGKPLEKSEICALLGYYASYSGNSLPAFRNNLATSLRVKISKKKASHTLICGLYREVCGQWFVTCPENQSLPTSFCI
jgi:hypothetical protein